MKLSAAFDSQENILAAVLLPAMVQRFRLSPEGVRGSHPDIDRDIKRTCRGCAAAQACLEALETGASIKDCQAFCPNSGALNMLLRLGDAA